MTRLTTHSAEGTVYCQAMRDELARTVGGGSGKLRDLRKCATVMQRLQAERVARAERLRRVDLAREQRRAKRRAQTAARKRNRAR